MKKKLSMLMVSLVALAAFATTMSLTNARRVVSELAVVSEATTWDFSNDVTLASTYSGDFKADDKTVENIYANFDVLTFGENFKADALAFKGEYPFRSNSKKFAQNGTLHFKTSVAGKIVVKFSDTGSGASASAVKRYLVVNGTQTEYWTSRENNGDNPYPAQLNVTTDEIEVPAGDVTIAGSSSIVVSYVSWAPNATPEPATQTTSTYVFTTSAWKATKDGVAADWTSNKAGNGFNNNGVQVTTGTTGAGATSPESYNNITKIVVTYNTNKTAGAGTFDVKIGDNDAVSKDWAYSSSAEDGRVANFTLTYDYATPQSGAVTITANTTANSIYVVSIAITHDAAEPGPGPEPVGPQDIVISPASGDIATALAEATAGKEVKSITINLTKGVTYTASAALVTPADFTINGNGATIDASALETNLIQMAAVESPTEWIKADVTISGVTVKGLKKALFYSTNKKYIAENFIIDNCVVELAADATTIDYTKGSTAKNITVTNSTFYAPTATTKSFYSSQGGEKYTEYDTGADAMQTFTFTNNTMYNLAKTKNFFTHRQNSQKWLTYDVKNNIFVNCGKSGQTIKGINGGGSSANPTWNVDNNAFNFDGADTSASESTGDTDEPIKSSVAGIMAFTDAAAGDFSGEFGVAGGASIPEVKPGDPRWAVEFKYVYKDVETLAAVNALENADKFYYTGVAQIVAQGKAGENVYTYIKDESASSLIFDADGTKSAAAVVGRNIAANWTGDVAIVNGMFQLLPTEALTLAEGEAQTVEYPVVDFSYITADHANEAVMLSGVSYQFVNEEELNITKGESQLAAVNKFGLNPGFAKKGVEYNIVGVINVDNDKVAFWPVEFKEKPTMSIDVKPAADSDIAEAVAEASEGIFVQDITITLEADKAYTMSAPIAAPANLTIIGAAGATIDASAVSGPLFQYAVPATPAAAPRRAPATPVAGYTYIDNVSIKDVTITGVKGSIYWDGNQKVCIENFSIENAEIALETESSSLKDNTIISFQGGCAKDFTIKNSTVYGNAGAKYFNKANNGADFVKAGYDAATVTYENNTFYNVLNADGQWGNNLRYNNNYAKITLAINGNIWYECGNGQILRRMLNKNFKDFKAGSTMANNTFWSADKPVDQGNYGNGSDLTTNPYFQGLWKELAEGELFFAVDEVSAQATNKTGDQRWGTWAPKHYTITVSEEAKQFADFTVLASALDGETVKVDVKEKNGFQLKELIVKVGAQTKLTVTDNSFVMPPANVTIDATFDKIAADYELAPAAGTDIAAALEGLIIRNLKLTLAENGAYTLTKSIEFSGDLDIVGKGATIDASTLETPFISLSATPAVKPIVDSKTDETTGETTETIKSYPIGSINIHDVTVKGLSQQLVKSNNLYLVNSLTVENAVVEIKGAVKKSIFDFSGANGNVIALIVNNSTLYADAETQWANGGFFSNQSGKKHSELGVDTEAEGFQVVTAIMNSTLYNISGGKTTSTLRENSKPFMKYAVKNSIIVNSGKKDQFLKGLNSGQAGNDANWDVDGNLFNFDGAMAKEVVNKAENIKNTVEGVITFADAAAGVFNYTYVKDPRIAEWPAIGDKRWTATAGATAYAINVDEAIVNGTVTPSATWSVADETIKLTVKPDEGYELASLVVMLGKTELELGEDNSFLMPAADVTVTATFVAVPKLYIIGGPKEWKLDDMTEMKYNLETQTYEFEYAPTAVAYFAFADKQFTADEAAAEGAWDVFNANNRIALGADNVDAVINGEPAQLQKVNGTIVLKAGTYKISVTKDLKMTITGEVAPEPSEDTYIIAGSSAALLGTEWDGTNEANKLTLNETTGLYEKTYEGVTLAKGTIEFKIVKNGTTWIPDGMGNNHTCEIPADGVYTVKVTFNAANPEKVDDYEMVATPATGINGVKAEALDNAVIYNLQGVRVEKSQAKGGVFIVNGRKMHLK